MPLCKEPTSISGRVNVVMQSLPPFQGGWMPLCIEPISILGRVDAVMHRAYLHIREGGCRYAQSLSWLKIVPTYATHYKNM